MESVPNVTNDRIAEIFDEIGDLLEIEGENTFRVRAYHTAARTLRDCGYNIPEIVHKHAELPKLAGIGEDLQGKIEEIVNTGNLKQLATLRRKTPQGLTDLLTIPGLGPKKVKVLWDKLGIRTKKQLADACRDHRVSDVRGFGAKTEARLLEAIGAPADANRRFLLHEIKPVADSLLNELRSAKGVKQVVIAGSFRRGKESVGDLDILATAKDSGPVIEKLAHFQGVVGVLARGTTKVTIRLQTGLQVDLRIVEDASFGAALHYFTGSKAHNIAMRQIAVDQNLKINEYGVYRDARRIAGATEESVYAAVGLPYICPELRENRGEIEAAQSGTLPKPIERPQIHGDLHLHIPLGAISRDWFSAAKRRNLSYLAVVRSSHNFFEAGALNERAIADSLKEVDRAREESPVVLLSALETETDKTGVPIIPDRWLREFELVYVTSPNTFGLSPARQTDRILHSFDNRNVHALSRPAGRTVLGSDSHGGSLERILERARDRGILVELDGHPDRLDLPDVYCQFAKTLGVKILLTSAAETPEDITFLDQAVIHARRGWLEVCDVVNAQPLEKVREALRA